MTKIKIYQVDTFTNKLFSGNPAAVCPLNDWLTDEVMQSIAKENNLSETAFFIKKKDKFFLRWFTPEVEIGLCGHATLAAAHVIFTEMNFKSDIIEFNIKSGITLTVTKNQNLLTLNFPAYIPKIIDQKLETLYGAFGIKPKDIDKTAVEKASKIANLHEFVMNELSNNYNTTVGERGIRLSGGQRQRIGIARALYHNPQILVLDEATSALDSYTESVVMDAIENLGKNKTVILIAHRLSTVKKCDKIFLLEEGQIKKEGTFEQLITTDYKFKKQ